MKINLAKYAGFCFGVKRAMDIVVDAAEKSKTKIYTLGPLIHNEQVVEYLEGKNVYAVDSNGKFVFNGIVSENIKKADVFDKYVEMRDEKFSNMYDNYENLGYNNSMRGDSDFYSSPNLGGYFGSNGIYN